MRNLTKTIAAVTMLAPASAYSLGIGDIKLHSALNQKLDAEISLVVSGDEKASSIKVKLAPPEKFDAAGVPWNYFLSKIKFASVTNSDGSVVVKLSTTEVLKEPFLDFLLEVSWDKGSLYREFTVLVDPPAAYTQPVIPVIEKVTQVEVVSELKPVEVDEELKPDPISVVDSNDEESSIADSSYGPTKKTDSVWKIAKQSNHYSDVSLEQMMMAIYQQNPKAFYKKNINALMTDKTLDIPEKEVILKFSQKEALVAFKQQHNEWTGRVSQKQDEQAVVPADKELIKTQLELEAPVEEKITASVVVVSDDDVKADSQIKIDDDSATISSNEESLVLLARMEKLEQQLLLMQKMLILKDEQIFALQNKAKLADTKAVIKEDVKVKEEAKAKEEVKVKEEVIKSSPSVPEEKNKSDISTTKAEIKPVIEAKKKDVKKVVKKPKKVIQAEPEPEMFTDTVTLALGGAGALILGALGFLWWRKRKGVEETETESMFAYASEISLPDSSLEDVSTSMPEEDLSTPITDDNSSYEVGTVGESSFLSEFTPSDFDVFDTDSNEVDPISEADVYLAYGRYQQAEELMLQAIEDQPDREECKLKLLEIFYANENVSAFEAFATELVSAGKNNDHAFWAKVVEMGAELAPTSPLFSDEGKDKAVFESVSVEGEPASDESTSDEQPVAVEETNIDNEETVDESNEAVEENNEAVTDNTTDDGMDFDLSVFDDDGDKDSLDQNTNDDEVKGDEGLDFDLSVFDVDDSGTKTESIDATEEKESANEVLESVDFDLDSLSLDGSDEKGSTEERVNTTDDDLESFDFDFDGKTEEITEKQEPEELNLDEATDQDDSLESFDFSVADTLDDNKVDLDVKQETESKEEFDFDLELPESKANNGALETGVSDLTDMDELETKIDLAKAYIDMEDFDAAKNIADEVLDKGNEEQKKEAQKVLDLLK